MGTAIYLAIMWGADAKNIDCRHERALIKVEGNRQLVPSDARGGGTAEGRYIAWALLC